MGSTSHLEPTTGGIELPRVVASARQRWRELTAAELAERVQALTTVDLRPTDNPTTDGGPRQSYGQPHEQRHEHLREQRPDTLDGLSLKNADAQRWQRRYASGLVVLDALAFLAACSLTLFVSGRWHDGVGSVPYVAICAVAVPVWVAMIALSRGYESRFLGLGSEEFRRVGNAGVRFVAIAAVTSFAVKADVARSLIGLSPLLATVLALALRYCARQSLHRVRATGSANHRVVVLGEHPQASALVARLDAAPHAGLTVVSTCWPGRDRLIEVAHEVALLGADTVAVAHSPGVTPEVLRRLSWMLEGSGVQLLVAPAFTDVAGPRINVRPVSGLPLLQIAEPQFSGARRLVKNTFDRTVAMLLILLASPLLITLALTVRFTSRGPVIFRQKRIGRGGKPFTMLKFRSMHADAEARLAQLEALNEREGGLFKIRNDPRITPVGRYLRRYSLDELPQLFNVVTGQMSLVGPRPPLPREVAQYESDAHRRLLVTPGLTGLWQVSGRSELSWDETVRLDLYYVENWSVALDMEILWKTAFAVVRGSGAH